MQKNKLSVIIVTWNSQRFIENCLDSVLREVNRMNYEIFIVDNASEDLTVELIQSRFPEITLIKNEKNVGFAAANNQAIHQSTGELVLLINPDAVILPGALMKMMAFIEQNPSVGIVGPKILNDDGSIQYTCARKLPSLLTETWALSGLDKRFRHSRVFGRYLMSYWDHQDSRYVELISGACMMVRREIFQRCGPLDDRFFFMYEDVEFCHRVLQQGYKIYYLADAVVRHAEGRSRTINIETHYRTALYTYHSMMQYYALTRGWFYTLLLRMILGVGRALLLVRQFMRWILASPTQRPQAQKKLEMYYKILKFLVTGYRVQQQETSCHQ
jgi:hypothetical protein